MLTSASLLLGAGSFCAGKKALAYCEAVFPIISTGDSFLLSSSEDDDDDDEVSFLLFFMRAFGFLSEVGVLDGRVCGGRGRIGSSCCNE